MISNQLTQLILQLGLPTPRSLNPLSREKGFEDAAMLFGDTMAEDFIILRAVHDGWGWVRLERELAALAALEDQELPTIKGYRLLRTLGRPTAIFPPPPGANVRTILQKRPDLDELVFTVMGHAMRRIYDVNLSQWGHAAEAKRFVAMASSPGEEYRLEAHQNAQTARRNGVTLGTLGRELLQSVNDACDDISKIDAIHLVHREIGPDALWLTPRPDGNVDISAVINWGDAIAGDPLAEWAPALFAPLPWMTRAIRGFGPEEAANLLNHKTAETRLKAYASAHLLRALALVRNPTQPGSAPERIKRVQILRQNAQRLLQPQFVTHTIQSAFDGVSEPKPGPSIPAPNPIQAGYWRALDLLRYPASVTSKAVLLWCGGLATLALKNDPSFIVKAHQHFDAIPVGGAALQAPNSDEPNLEDWITETLVKRPRSSERWMTLIAMSHALTAITHTQDVLDDGMWAGLQRLTLRLISTETDHSGSNQERFVHALVGLAALQIVSDHTTQDLTELREALEHQLHDGWYAIEPMILATHTQAWTETIEQLLISDWRHLPLGPWVPLVLSAIRALADELPAPPEEVLHALSLVPTSNKESS